jgi:hypothetical protein
VSCTCTTTGLLGVPFGVLEEAGETADGHRQGDEDGGGEAEEGQTGGGHRASHLRQTTNFTPCGVIAVATTTSTA